MFCPNCRNQVVDGAEFCSNCGANLKQIKEQLQNQNILQHNQLEQPVMQQNYNQYNIQSSMNNQNKRIPILLIIIVIVLAVIAVFGTSKLIKKDKTPTYNNSNTEQVQENNNSDEKENATNESGNITGIVDKNTILTYDANGAFLMAIKDVYNITDRGTVVTGTIERGTINVGDKVQVIGLNQEIITTTITDIELFEKSSNSASIGNDVVIFLNDITKEDVQRGQVLAQPNSIKAATKFEANIYLLTKEEGGRHNPIFSNYRPQFYFRNTDITGNTTIQDGVEIVIPGDSNVKITVELISNVAMEVGTEFSIREAGHTVGRGTVTKVY